ncbi:lamin tail domain-containing protein, partial [bacterium]|nr:lamin tail domain-containing protein [bacterium]
GEWQLLSEATPGVENRNPVEPEEIVLFINEFLALNEGVNTDETGAYEDWVEIYNPGPEPVEMGGLFLTDDLTNTTQWTFPDTTLQAGEFLLVWCDNDPEDGAFHATFKLSGDGEAIGLFGRLAAGNELIDSYIFGAQTTDISEGRETDGGDSWVFFDNPTPGASNSQTAVENPLSEIPDKFALFQNYPNPFNPTTTIQYTLPEISNVSINIYDILGRVAETLAHEKQPAGQYQIVWNAGDRPSGLYFIQMKAGDFIATKKMVLLK